MSTTTSVDALFAGKAPHLRPIYDQLIIALAAFGPFHKVPKQSSIQLKKTSAFAAIQLRKNHLNLEFRIDYEIDDPRATKHLQLSARRHVYTVKLEQTSDIDSQLLKWLNDAYDICK